MSGHPQKMGSGGTGSLRPSPALFLSRLHNNPCAQDALPQFRAVPFYIVERRRSSYEFTFRPVGIADPCVFDKPLMLHPAVWTVGAAEKYRVLLNNLDSMCLPVEIARPVFGQRIISMPIKRTPAVKSFAVLLWEEKIKAQRQFVGFVEAWQQ